LIPNQTQYADMLLKTDNNALFEGSKLRLFHLL